MEKSDQSNEASLWGMASESDDELLLSALQTIGDSSKFLFISTRNRNSFTTFT